MVLLLQELSLVSARNNLENGRRDNVNKLSVPLREKLLKLILMHGTINNPSCLRALSSPEYLEGFTSINTQCGHVDDHLYLDRVAATIAKHKSIGQGIKELRLTIYGGYVEPRMFSDGTKEMNMRSVVQLIGSCRNLERLDLTFVEYGVSKAEYRKIGPTMFNVFDYYSDCRGFLNDAPEMRSCRTVLENLTELSLTGRGTNMAQFVKDDSMIGFKNLTTLILSNVNVFGGAWKKFLTVIRNKLTLLQLDGVSVDGPTLPISLPCLDTLVIDGEGDFDCDPIFLANLKECGQLQCVSLELTDRHDNEKCLMELSQVDVLSEMKIRFGTEFSRIDPSDETMFDDSSKLKLVSLFGEKITSVSVAVEKWTPRWTAAMEHIVETCHGLTELVIDVENVTGRSEQELSKANLFLLPLFSSEERASKLRKLHLMGGFASNVIDAMVKNCVNVGSLEMWSCEEFTDEHCREFVRRGGKLTSFQFIYCSAITDEGILPILENSGNLLKNCNWQHCFRVTDRSFALLFEHCRYLKNAWMPDDMPDHKKEHMRKKCFNVFL